MKDYTNNDLELISEHVSDMSDHKVIQLANQYCPVSTERPINELRECLIEAMFNDRDIN